MKFLLVIFLLGLLSPFGYAQKLDSIQNLNEVTVISSRIKDFNVGNQVIIFDSISKNLNNSCYLTNELNELSSLNIRSNGLGLSTISARGSGSSHTPILWNGFNMEDIMGLGVDVSLLPSVFFEDISVQLGGSSALFGSGAIGGAVHLNNRAYFKQPIKVKVTSSLGSFGNYFGGIGVNYGNTYYATSLKIFYNDAKNNFPFSGTHKTDTLDHIVDTTQINAGFKQIGAMFNNYFKISENQNLNINFWIQNSDKNIAPTLEKFVKGPIDTMRQVNDNFKGSVEYSYLLNNLAIKAKSGFFTSNLDYTSNSYNELDQCLLSISEIEGTYLPNSYLKIYGGVNYTYEEANSPGYPDIKSRNRVALFSSVKASNENSQAVFNIRAEKVDKTIIPMTFSFGINQLYFNGICQIHANVSKNYKLPSFNDLYYTWGGNPDLKPESGLNYEGGISLHFKNQYNDFKINSTIFHSDMDNWIKWMEVSTYNWKPFNIDKVKMDGLDNLIEYKKTISKWNLGLKGMYTYIDAINVNTGSEITYTPEHKLTGMLTVLYGPIMLRYSEQYQSEVYYEKDSTMASLPSVELSNIAFSYSHSVKTTVFKVTLQINNLFNKDYMYVSKYPMPRRNFQLGLQVEF